MGVALLLSLPATTLAGDFSYTTNSPDTNAITITRYTGLGGTVQIPDSIDGKIVAGLKDNAFYDYANPVNVTVPASLTHIESLAFYHCSGLTAIHVDPSNTVYSSMDGVLFDKGQTLLFQYPGGKAGEYVIPDSVTEIKEWGFSFCGGLTRLGIGQNLILIGTGALTPCTNLTEIAVNDSNSVYCSVDGVLLDTGLTTLLQCPGGRTGSYAIPSGIATIGDRAFAYCIGMSHVTIPGSITNIGLGAFYFCGLTNVVIPEGVVFIGNNAFESCLNLLSANLPDTLLNVGSRLFSECGNLTDLVIGDGVIDIGKFAFAHCTSLTNVVIGDSVRDIGDAAFIFCTSLERIVMPESVVEIGNGAFTWCDSLSRVYFMGNAPGISMLLPFHDPPMIYYLPGTTGWDSLLWDPPFTTPTTLWLPEATADGSFGVQGNQFGFNVGWAKGKTVVVEGCTNMADPVWVSIQTNTLADGPDYFGDSEWTNHAGRYYRLREP